MFALKALTHMKLKNKLFSLFYCSLTLQLFLGCNYSKLNPDYSDTSIKMGIDTEVDFSKSKYIVHYLSGKSIETSFYLTQAEKMILHKAFESINILEYFNTHTDPDSRFIACDNLSTPTINSTIEVKIKKNIETMTIVGTCEKISTKDAKTFEAATNYIRIVFEILLKKPEIAKIPNSDIFYY